MTRRLLVLLIALVGVLSLACDDGDAGGPTARETAAFPAVTPAAGLPCEVPDNVKSYRWAWDMKMTIPGPEMSAGDDELSRLVEELEGQEVSPEDFNEVWYVMLMVAFQGGRAPAHMEYAFVAPDRTEVRIMVGDFETVAVTIGDREWLKFDPYGWRETGTEGHRMGPMPELSSLCGGFRSIVPPLGPGEREEDPGHAGEVPLFPNADGVKGQEEMVDGIAALHYHVEETDRVRIGELLGGDASDLAAAEYPAQQAAFDWWLATEGNWPVRMDVVVRSRDEEGSSATFLLSTHVKDLNDPSIKIDPPTGGD